MTKFYLYVLGVMAMTLGATTAISDEEMKAVRVAVLPFLEACEKEFDISKEKIQALKESGDLGSIDPCFYACFFKKTGSIDANGLYDPNALLDKYKSYFKNEDDLAYMTQIGKICSAVNEETVSDGDKGCERSKLMLACFVKEKASFSPFASTT